MTFEIKRKWTNAVLYRSENATTLRGAVIEATKKHIDLTGADLTGAYLTGAYLRGAYLTGAYLTGAYLTGAYLTGADLRGADLTGADLTGVDLTGVDLRGVDLRGADLTGAYLRGAINGELAAAMTVVAGQGELRAWKKIREGVIELRIPAEAKRSNATGRKCRAEFAVVVSLPDGIEVGHSLHDGRFEYRVGQTVRPTNADWCDDRWRECAPGIHFYITREEAEAHA